MKLRQTAFEALPLGSIKPEGWVKNQLRIQADGFSGHLEQFWSDVGPDNGWIGGRGESWERGPYYLDGLVPLAYLLEDPKLIAKANRWIEWALASQQANGSFGPEHIQTVNIDVNKTHDWWHYMIMLKVLTQHEEATGDIRIVPFLTRYFRYAASVIREQPLEGWAKARGAEMMLCILWLYKRTSDTFLLELADVVGEQTINWTEIYHDFPFWRKVEQWDWRTHVVNVAMSLKAPAIRYQLYGEAKDKEAVYRGIDSLMTFHGQAHGMFSGDEWLAGTHPSQGVELCAVVEYMFSMEHLVRILGDGRFGDILEKVAFNALPAAVSADWTSHQYDQQVNQIMCNVADRDWSNGNDANIFGLEPTFGCCTANMHQGWPKFVSHLWMSDGNGGAAVVSYSPCTVRTQAGSGTTAQFTVSGEYPFRENVKIGLALGRSETFALHLRIPGWCRKPSLTINGEQLDLRVEQGFAKIERQWNDGDAIQLHLPMETQTVTRNLYAVSVERGPLVYVLPVKENWQSIVKREKFHDWEIYPASPWKYGILADTEFHPVMAQVPFQPFEAARTPVRLIVQGKLIRDWKMEGNNAGTPPLNPDTEGQPVTDLELVPYGSAKLRIGEFPLIGERKRPTAP